MKTIKPILKEIDITNISRKGDGILKEGLTYLCLIDGKFHTGHFTKSNWYGLMFNLGSHSVQYHPPGDNYSSFQKVWLIENAKQIANSERKAFATIRRKYAAEHGLTHYGVKCSMSDPLSHYYYFNDPKKTKPEVPDRDEDWD